MMGIIRLCNDYDQAAELLGVVAEYIDFPHNECNTHLKISHDVQKWIDENLEGIVACIFEDEYQKTFTTLLFQHKEDAVAFKLYWM